MTTPDDNAPQEPIAPADPLAEAQATDITEPVNEDSAVLPVQGVPSPTPYAAPPAPAQTYGSAPNPMPNTWMNITAFVTGLLGLAIIPVIFGHLGVSQSNKGKADFKWMGIVGLVLGYLAIVGWIIFVVAISTFVATADITYD